MQFPLFISTFPQTPEMSLDISKPCDIYFSKIFYIRLVDGGGNSDKVNFIISELVFLLL